MGDIVIPKFRNITVRAEDLASISAEAGVPILGGAKRDPMTEHVRVSHDGRGRVIVKDGRPGHERDLILSLPWKQSLELARSMKVQALGHPTANIQVLENGVLLLELPAAATRKLAGAIRVMSARAEQSTKLEKVIMDQAIFIRAGFPIALTNRPDVFKEAGNEAAHDRDLRRFMPGSIPSGVKFGYPTLIGKKPAHRIGVKGIESAEVFGKF